MTHTSAAEVRPLPGPRPDRLGGALGNVIRFSRDPIGTAEALFRTHGPLIGLTGGDPRSRHPYARWVLVHGAALNREVVTRPDDFHKPPLNKQLSPQGDRLTDRQQAMRRWGAGLFGINGEEHRRQRRLMMPAFHKSRIDTYGDEMVAMTEEAIAAWTPGTVRDLRAEMVRLTIRIVGRCLLGEPTSERSDALGELIQTSLRLVLRPEVFLLPYDVPGAPYRRLLDVVEATDRHVREAIAEKRRAGVPGEDVLSMLLLAREEDGSCLSEDQLISHAGVMFIAGHETSSNALVWALLLLSQHPQMAADLQDELEAALSGARPTAAKVNGLPLLDAVVRESLRVCPPVPMNARVVARDTTLGGCDLPAGTQLLMSLYHTHRAPDVFHAPRRFDPRRWETCDPDAYAYMPFGVGPRTCIGAPFAMLEMKLVLATILQRLRLEPVPGTRVDRSVAITLSVKDGLPMMIRPQDRQFTRGVGGLRGNFTRMVDLPA